MRLSNLFFATLRDDPNNAEMPSHRLLVRAGYVRQLGSGIYSLLPLGFRVAKRVEQVIREEMDRIGCQEMEMPVVHPAELWRETGRYDAIGPEMARFKDRAGRDMVLAMTHEEVVADLLRDIVRSYRQLPMMVYHFQTKLRDEPRARGGLIRVREFVMKDSYSCDLDLAGLDVSYERHYEAYTRIFERLGLRAIAVASDVGMMGGSQAHEFMVLNPFGEDVLVLCETCGFSANRQVATVRFSEPPDEPPLPLEEVATPGAATIADLAALLGVERREDGQGDLLRRPRGPPDHRHRPRRHGRQRDQARQRGEGGRAAAGADRGDRGRRDGARLRVADRRARHVRGGGRAGCPVLEPRRRREPGRVPPAQRQRPPGLRAGPGRRTSPTPARATAAPSCGAPVILRNGIEVGNIFKLGTKYTAALGAEYLGEDGWPPPDRDGQLRDRRGPGPRLHRRGAPRREGDRLARGGGAVRRPPRLPRGDQGSAASRRLPSACTTWPATRAMRSCGMTATNLRA